WAVSLLETGKKDLARAKFNPANFSDEPAPYLNYVAALINAGTPGSQEKVYESLAKAFAVAEDGKLNAHDWAGPHRRSKASDLLYSAAQQFGGNNVQKAFASQQLAISLERRPGCFAALAQFAYGAGKYEATVDAATRHLATTPFEMPEKENDHSIKYLDYQVALRRAEAAGDLKDYSKAARWFKQLADLYRANRLENLQAKDCLGNVLDPGIDAAKRFGAAKPNDSHGVHLTAELLAAKGRLLYENEFSSDFTDAKAKARAAF